MRVTHGSASESSDLAGSFSRMRLDPRALDALNTPSGTVLNSALRRVREELDDPRPVWAGFDNKA